MRVRPLVSQEAKAWHVEDRRAEARALLALRAFRRRRLSFAQLWQALQHCPPGRVWRVVEAEVLAHRERVFRRWRPCA